ncbi:MAG: lytic transglycosylase domain-containing protein [Gammaproteobacteria bacterium]
MNRIKLSLICLLGLLFIGAEANANQENPADMRKTALAYEHARGVKQDYQKAFELYCQAALSGDAQSAYNLGFMYFNGRGLPRDFALAGHWFGQAAKGGDKYARRMLGRLRGMAASEDPACHTEPVPMLVENPDREVIEQWVGLIAPKYGIDPELVMAVIQAESAFNPKAKSDKNAQGLMQLIPATAERFGVEDSWDPIQNIRGGIAYLNWLMRHFGGNVEWVLAAYNAGEGAVERYQGIPPYHETQHYVKKILAHYPKTNHPVPPELTSESL